MPITFFHVIHVFALIALVGIFFAALAAPQPENRRRYLMWSGIASLAVMLTGFGMLGMMKLGWPIWVWIKILCWIGLSALVGQAFRRKEKSRELLMLALGLALIALCMVYFKPL